MSFSYQSGANPPIDYPRLLVSDTQEFAADGTTPIYAFEDPEITAATAVVSGVMQSGQFYTPPMFLSPLASPPVPYYRIAAVLLFSLAANKARLSAIRRILDVELDAKTASQSMRDTAQSYLDLDDNSGAFAIIEQVNDVFSFRDRFWKQVQRQAAQ